MRIFKSLFFIFTNIALVLAMNFLLVRPSGLKFKIQELNADGKSGNGYDFILLGQSHMGAGISTEVLDKKLGCASYNCAGAAEQITTLHYLLDEITANNKVKTIVFGIDVSYWTMPDSDRYGTGVLDFATRPGNKIKYVCLQMLFSRPFTDIAMYDLNKKNLLNIINNVKMKSGGYTQGEKDSATDGLNLLNDGVYKLQVFKSSDVLENKVLYFEKFAKECGKKGINLVCITSALPPYRLSAENYYDVHDFFENFCRKIDVPYYDMNYAKELANRTDDDYTDKDGHMKKDAAEKQTELLCDILKSSAPETYFFKDYSDLLRSMNLELY